MVQIIGEFGAAVAEAEQEAPEQRGFLFCGELFFVDAEGLGFIPYGKFCQAALSGRDTEEAEGAAAVMELMQDIVGADPGKESDDDGPTRVAKTKAEEWARFCDVATTHKQKMVHLMEIIRVVMTGASGYPTKPPSASPSGQSKMATSRNSSAKSSRSGDPRKRAAKKPDPKHDFEPVTDDVIAGLRG